MKFQVNIEKNVDLYFLLDCWTSKVEKHTHFWMFLNILSFFICNKFNSTCTPKWSYYGADYVSNVHKHQSVLLKYSCFFIEWNLFEKTLIILLGYSVPPSLKTMINLWQSAPSFGALKNIQKNAFMNGRKKVNIKKRIHILVKERAERAREREREF